MSLLICATRGTRHRDAATDVATPATAFYSGDAHPSWDFSAPGAPAAAATP